MKLRLSDKSLGMLLQRVFLRAKDITVTPFVVKFVGTLGGRADDSWTDWTQLHDISLVNLKLAISTFAPSTVALTFLGIRTA